MNVKSLQEINAERIYFLMQTEMNNNHKKITYYCLSCMYNS
jgi:hypothetical protein